MIQITTLRYDDENDIRIEIKFQNSECTSSLKIYGDIDIFSDFAKQLIDFNGQKAVVYNYGEDDDKWAYYLSINISVFDPTGKVVIKTLVDNKGDVNYNYRCTIPLITEIATVNELGKALLKWKPVENEVWRFPADT
jgi:hypothetical protein